MRPIFFSILFLLSIRSNAQILYECKSLNGDTVFYVLGTCHYLPGDSKIDTFLLGTLMRDSDVIFSELYVDDGDSSYSKVASGLRDLLKYKDNGQLSERVTKKEYARVMKYYRSQYGISQKKFHPETSFLPWVMHNRLKYKSRGYISLDSLLHAMAKTTKNKIKNLDHEQLLRNAYTQLSLVFDTKWLLDLVDEKVVGRRNEDLIIQSYLRQDTAGVTGALRQSNPKSMHQEVLIDNRNKHWFTVIDQHAGRTNFIYCGLAHIIVGEFSLLNFFRARQYSVQGIPIDIVK